MCVLKAAAVMPTQPWQLHRCRQTHAYLGTHQGAQAQRMHTALPYRPQPAPRTCTQLSSAVGLCSSPYKLPLAQNSVTSARGATVHTATSFRMLGCGGRLSIVSTSRRNS